MGQLDFAPRVESDIERIKESDDLSENDKELLLDFKRDMKLDGASDVHLHKVLIHLRLMGERLNPGFEAATVDEIKDVVEWVQNRDRSDATKQHYKKSLKRFYKWLNGGEYPEEVKWINTTLKRKDRKLPEKLLTEEDVDEMIEAAENPRDRALVAILWETGARIGEVLSLTVGGFEERRHGKKILIDGKTGPRRLPLITSVPQVNNWLSNHPLRDDPEAPLWCRLHGEKAGEELSYRYILKSLKEIAERAGVDKPANPHHFRHSRATYLANRMTEAQMCEYFGWVQGSDRPADYVHLSGRDIDLTYDRMHGYEERGESEKPGMSPRDCPRCGEMNDPGAKFCQRCGLALDEETAMEMDEKRAIGEMVMEKVEELSEEGTLDELIEKAVEERVKETLSEKSSG